MIPTLGQGQLFLSRSLCLHIFFSFLSYRALHLGLRAFCIPRYYYGTSCWISESIIIHYNTDLQLAE